MNEEQVVTLLRDRYCKDAGNGPAAVLLPQVRNAAGFDATRTADALVMQLWPSRGLHLEGFEIKCSRADVLKELRDPSKAESIAQWCEKWWLVVADKSFVKDGELPDLWGLIVVSKSGTKLTTIKAAPVRSVPAELPKSFLASMLRQADREAQRPGAEALAAEYERGKKHGSILADQDAAMYHELKARVDRFEEATGLRVDSYDRRLEESAAVARLLLGEFEFRSLIRRLMSLGIEAGKIVEELSKAGIE